MRFMVYLVFVFVVVVFVIFVNLSIAVIMLTVFRFWEIDCKPKQQHRHHLRQVNAKRFNSQYYENIMRNTRFMFANVGIFFFRNSCFFCFLFVFQLFILLFSWSHDENLGEYLKNICLTSVPNASVCITLFHTLHSYLKN